MAKPGPKPKPKDYLLPYLEEAHEEHRRFPKLKANAIGNRIAARHPNEKGLAQAIRKALRQEEKAASGQVETPVPSLPVPAAPPLSPAAFPRKRPLSAAQRAQREVEKTLGFKLQQLTEDLEKAKLYRHIIKKDQELLEALRHDSAFQALLRMLEDED